MQSAGRAETWCASTMSPDRLILLRISILAIFIGALGVVRLVFTTSFDYAQNLAMLDPMFSVITSPGSNVSIPARPAAFGPSIPIQPGDGDNELGGFTGSLSVVESLGCNPDEEPEDLREKIALVSRGGCGFYEKVLVLQKWGAVAVIVGDNAYHRGLITMFSKENEDNVNIPSLFVSRDSYDFLTAFDIVTITSVAESSAFVDTVLFLLVSPLFSLSMIYAILVVHRKYRIMKERLPKSYLPNIPTRIWVQPSSTLESSADPSLGAAAPNPGQDIITPATGESVTNQASEPGVSGNNGSSSPSPSTALASKVRHEKVWVSSGECIICLEDYVPEVSEVMRLPCGHEFHSTCITRWLVCRKKTCPICKMDVTENSSVTESTPLISRLMRRAAAVGASPVGTSSRQTQTDE